MPTVEVTAEIEVWCSCGKGLCRQSTGSRGYITVDPCEVCLKKAIEEGHSKGYDEGYEEGINKANNE